MSSEALDTHHRVLLLTTTRRDGEVSRRLLESAGIPCDLCADLADLCGKAADGVGTVVLPEELALAGDVARLAELVRRQPVWSDLPIVVLTRTGAESAAVSRVLADLGNVSLVERPVRVSTLLSVIRTSLRARERQYQVRDQLRQSARIQEELREAHAVAQAANRAKDQFLAVLSHELRTPLSPVVMTLSSLDEDTSLPDSLREDIAMMRRNIDLETQLIDDLLDLNRIANGKLRLRTQLSNLHAVVRHAIESCRSELSGKGIRTRLQLEAKHDRVNVDPARLQQVFWNLLKNAAKFTPVGGSVIIRSRNVEPASIELAVQDDGVGIEPGAIAGIFDAFDQGDARTTQQFGGLGLGLAISKAVVDMFGGTISAASDGKNRGSTFTVVLPTSTADPAPESEAPATPAREVRQRVRLLLVEDHADTARAMSRLLRRCGFHVETAHTVADALALADAQAFDLVISDIGLPDARGYELMRSLRSRGEIPGIALSGYGSEEDIQRSLAAGFSEHIVKPVNLTQVTSAIDRLIGLAAAEA